MSLKKEYVRDFNRQIVGNVTTGFDYGHGSVVRDGDNRMVGRTSTRFNETRDSNGHIVSSNRADAGLIIKKRK